MSGCAKLLRLRLTRVVLLGTAAATMPAWVVPALAQEAPAADDSASAGNEIIVTAQRRSERLEDVPMSVTAVSAETLASTGINTLRDLQNVTSGFNLNNSGAYPQPAIRGITTTNSGSYENNVALWVDGLYEITPQILNMDLPNVNSIQILKGPQGALYGRNATGGAILIDTIDPTDHLTGMAELTYGTFDDKRFRAYAAGPISDRIGISLAGTFRKTDGYYNRVDPTNLTRTTGHYLGLNQQTFRGKLRTELTDNFRATLAYNYIRSSDPRGDFFTPTENLTAASQASWGVGSFIGQIAVLDFRQHEASLKLEMDTGIGTLRSVTGYQRATFENSYDSTSTSYVPSTISDAYIHDTTWQENLDFTVKAIDRLDLVLGMTYFNNEEHYEPGRANAGLTAPAGSPIGLPRTGYLLTNERDSQRTKEAWAGFIDATFHVTDRLSINVGGRYSTETQSIHATNYDYCITTSCAYVPTTGFPGPASGTVGLGQIKKIYYDASNGKTYSKFTPRASIRYEISPRTNVYFTYSQGFKAGEWNGVIPGNNPATWEQLGQIGQETVDGFEAGFKTAGSRFRFDLAGFYYKYHNLQVSSVQFVGSPAVASVLLQSIPNARIYGVEANGEFKVTPDFTIRAGATWLNARYGDHAYYQGVGVNPAGTVAVPNPNNPLQSFPNTFIPPVWQDLSGQQMVRAPDFSAYAGFEYNIPHGDGGFLIAANVKYTSSYAVTDPSLWGGETAASYAARGGLGANGLPVLAPNNQQVFTAAGAAGAPYLSQASVERARQGAFALVNASVTWTDPTDRFYVRVWGNNLTDETYFVHYRPSSRTYTPIGEPRTVGVTIGAKFGGERRAVLPPPPPPPPAPVEQVAPPPPPPPPPPPAPSPGERG